MAGWQVEFHIVPRRAIAAAPQPLTRSVLDGADWWATVSFPADYHARLGIVSPGAMSGSAEHEVWGTEEGNRVDVWSTAGQVRRVMVRVDVRRLDSRFGAALLVFVRAADAVLIRGDGTVVEPTINAYAGALRGSTAWRYANDPAAFIAAHVATDEDED